VVIKRKEKLEKGQIKQVVDICHSAKLTKVTVDKTVPPAAPAMPVVTPAAAAVPDAPPATVSPPATTPAKSLPPAMLLPINIDLRPDGQVGFQGATYALNDLKPKLEELGKSTPQQPLVVTGRENATHGEIKKVVALCHEAKLTKVTVAKATPPTAPAVANGAAPATSAPSVTVATTPTVVPDSTTTSSVTHTVKNTSSVSHTASSAPISTGPEYTVP